MFLRRNFTVMVVPDARGGLRRFHLRGKQIAMAGAALLVVGVLAVVSPVLIVWGTSLSHRLREVQGERDQLAARADEVDASMRELRQKLDAFERRTAKLATLAGLDLPAAGGQGQGIAIDGSAMSDAARVSQTRGETEELLDRSLLLGRRLDTVENVLGEQSDRLAHTPSILPVHGLIGSGFSWRRDPFTGRRQFHRGLDLAAPEGTPVVAPADGIVVKTERHGGYGNVLYISHGDGIVTRYGHLHGYKVRPGQKVRRGDVIALVGNTGRSTAPHLHYEVLVGGKQVDPMKYVLEDVLY